MNPWTYRPSIIVVECSGTVNQSTSLPEAVFSSRCVEEPAEEKVINAHSMPQICLPKGDGEDQVLVSISYSFSRETPSWVYGSLLPLLETPAIEPSNVTGQNRSVWLYPLETQAKARNNEFLFCVSQNELPGPGQSMALHIGPRVHFLNPRPIDWSKAGLINQVDREISEGRMLPITLNDQAAPDWVILRSARLLKVDDGSILLETIIHNLSNLEVPINGLEIEISTPSPGMGACTGSDPTQVVTIDWERIIATAGEDGTGTDLGGTKVKVPTSYKLAGECDSYEINALVPIQRNIKPSSATRVTLNLKEIPKAPGFAKLPENLSYWQHWAVTVKADTPIWPEALLVYPFSSEREFHPRNDQLPAGPR
jgi:hypothetical protein